jgi:hypothetical protein
LPWRARIDAGHLADPHAGDPDLVARREPAGVAERGPVAAGGGQRGEVVEVERAEHGAGDEGQPDGADDERIAFPDRFHAVPPAQRAAGDENVAGLTDCPASLLDRRSRRGRS